MNIENKAEKLIIILTRATFEGKVEWKEETAPDGLTDGTDDIFPLYLTTTYKKSDIGLFMRRYKSYHDEFEYSWGEGIGMCIIGERRTILWEYSERSSALINLFEAAREQASGINSILDDLLN
mgnify:CR=1 FL=1